MRTSLTLHDRKLLKQEKRFGYAFSILILSFGALFNLIYLLGFKSGPDYLLLFFIDSGIVFLAVLVCSRMNRKVNRDLKENSKEVIRKTVDRKSDEISYEPGSGALHIPILGELFPSLWGQKMKEIRSCYLHQNGNKYEVCKEVYDELQENSDFYVHLASHSETILAVTTRIDSSH